ncbi:MAG: hypothetical protein C0597_06375, partial [Marinilabiliales bacterium]
ETKIYCGSNDGLWTYQINKKTFKYLGEENVSLSYKIDCIINNNFHNNIWIGTKSNGIILFNGDTTTYNITVEDGLSSNNITSLFQKDSIVWVSTINGLNKIVLNSHENAHDFNITNFSTIHGLSSNEIYDVYANDSIAYLATNKGLNLIRYKDYKSNLNPPGIFIKNIKVLDKDTTIKDYYELAYNQNSVYIEYVGLMYKNNGTKRYKYNFHQSGKKTRWNITTENFLRFSYLPPGNYNLEIIAINEDGVESSNPATLRFKIHPPFWKTYWFIALCLFITITITYLLYYSRLKELRKRNNIEKSLLKEVNIYKQQALGQQMNPHFIFNTLNSIQYFIYENNNESSIHYLSQFAQLMRIVLENSQHETIVIQKEFDALNLYLELESLRFENGFNYHIEIPNEIDTHSYYIYPLLIQPYIENSIWHGLYHKKGTKNLNIELLNKENYILCVIEDNGIGREKSGELNQRRRKKHKSLGTNITNKRIDAINKLYNQNFSVEFVDLKDKLGNPCGTKVLLKIPKITD